MSLAFLEERVNAADDTYAQSVQHGYNQGMGRGRLAGFCALAAATLAVLGAAGYVTPISVQLIAADHDVLLAHFYDGRTRVFWFHSPFDAFTVDDDPLTAVLNLRSRARRGSTLPDGAAGPPTPPHFNFPVQIGDRFRVPPLGGRWRSEIGPRVPPPREYLDPIWLVTSSFIRVPTWPLVLALMIPPVRRSILERRRARRRLRNECLACGYNLKALTEPRCPECGTPIRAV